MDSWYKNKFEDLNNKTTKHVDKVRSVREEIVTAKKDVSVNDLSLTCLHWAINSWYFIDFYYNGSKITNNV